MTSQQAKEMRLLLNRIHTANAELTAPGADRKKRTTRGKYIPGANRERLFILMRAAGFTLKETATLLRYTLREAYDLSGRVYDRISAEEAFFQFKQSNFPNDEKDNKKK